MRQTGNDAGFDWVAHDYEDWDISRCLLRRQRGRDVERHDNIYFEPNEFSCEVRKPIQLSLRGPKLECDILPLRITKCTQSVPQLTCERFCVRRSDVEDANARHFGLLRTRCKRPRCRRDSNNLHELASPHCRPLGSDRASYRLTVLA